MENIDTGIMKQPIVMPAVTADQALKAFEAYQDLAKKIITPDDVQHIAGKEFKKKSFWRKCQRFFNLTVQIVDEKREEYNGSFIYKFTVRATAPNGAFMDGTGACSSDEKGLLKTEHNTRAIAETRAKNRAISDLVAFGEVSAEEVTAEEVNGNGKSHKPAVEMPQEKKAVESQEPKTSSPVKSGAIISEPQAKRLYAIARGNGFTDEDLKAYLLEMYSIDSTRQILKSDYEAIVNRFQVNKNG